MKREWKESMGEISGFGGGYEAVCRAMLLAGVEWLEAHELAKPEAHAFKGVFGIVVPDNDDAKAVEKAMMDASVWHEGKLLQQRAGDDCTGAMVHACTNHLAFIRANGWDTYVRKLEEDEAKKSPEERAEEAKAKAEMAAIVARRQEAK